MPSIIPDTGDHYVHSSHPSLSIKPGYYLHSRKSTNASHSDIFSLCTITLFSSLFFLGWSYRRGCLGSAFMNLNHRQRLRVKKLKLLRPIDEYQLASSHIREDKCGNYILSRLDEVTKKL